jgi:hypothetical protein
LQNIILSVSFSHISNYTNISEALKYQ